MRYHIVVWPRRSSRLTFKELSDSFVEYLSLRFECTKSEEFSTDSETTNIVLGANDSIFEPRPIPSNCIIVNMEQLGKDQLWSDNKYIDLLKKYPVWDYSTSNIEQLANLGITKVKKLEIGYTLSLETCQPKNIQDIDVLFFGALNKRRRDILSKLKSIGYKVHFSANLFGTTRDVMIARSKIVLNIHYYESKILEVVRISHLLANKKCVISERGCEDNVNKVWEEGVVLCDYDEIVSNVMIYLFSDERRKNQERKAYEFIRKHPLSLPL